MNTNDSTAGIGLQSRAKDPSMPSMSTTKPVQLQLNNSGAWKTIACFDAADAIATGYIQEAAKMLKMVDPFGKYRIATRDSLPLVLMYLGDDLEWGKA